MFFSLILLTIWPLLTLASPIVISCIVALRSKKICKKRYSLLISTVASFVAPFVMTFIFYIILGTVQEDIRYIYASDNEFEIYIIISPILILASYFFMWVIASKRKNGEKMQKGLKIQKEQKTTFWNNISIVPESEIYIMSSDTEAEPVLFTDMYDE